MPGFEIDPANRLADLGDPRLAAHFGTVGELGADFDVLKRRRQDRPLHGQHPARLAQGVLEAARDAGHGQHEQVAERVAAEGRAFAEAVLEQARHERLDLGKGHDVVAEIPRRQDAVLTPQTSRRAAVVADGHDRGDVG